jgi:nicotinate-nucleotide adenylyltransferase
LQRIGIIGGTFDPIHTGHLIIAQEVCWSLGLSKILFVPAGDPPHKQNVNVTSAEHRLAMVRLGIAGNPAFEISNVELERGGLSYTADTLETLHRQLGPDTELYFIIGVDAAAELLNWYHPDRVIKYAKLAVVSRPGYRLPLNHLEKGLPGITERIVRVDTPLIELASNEIRQRVSRGAPICYLVPSEVEDYIRFNSLYQRPGGYD